MKTVDDFSRKDFLKLCAAVRPHVFYVSILDDIKEENHDMFSRLCG